MAGGLGRAHSRHERPISFASSVRVLDALSGGNGREAGGNWLPAICGGPIACSWRAPASEPRRRLVGVARRPLGAEGRGPFRLAFVEIVDERLAGRDRRARISKIVLARPEGLPLDRLRLLAAAAPFSESSLSLGRLLALPLGRRPAVPLAPPALRFAVPGAALLEGVVGGERGPCAILLSAMSANASAVKP